MRAFKLSDSEKRLLLLFLAVLMFAAAYFLSFQRNIDRAEEIEAQNVEDQAYVDLLESMVARRPQIEAQTLEYRQTIEEIIAKYPPDVPTEKVITIIQELEDRTGVTVNNISFSMDNIIVDLSTSAVADDGAYSAGVYSVGYRDTIGMTYYATYSDFKRMISYINGLSDRTTIPSITAVYDSDSGFVSGVISINMFYLTDTGREYEVPEITGNRKGVQSIFNPNGSSR